MENNKVFSEEYIDAWNSYFYEDSEVFKNKFGIKDSMKLEEVEAQCTFDRLVELYNNPIEGKFDKKHLCDIHRYIFQDVYDWAGEFRRVHMGKNSSHFVATDSIGSYLDYELSLMNDAVRDIYSKDMFACFLAEYYVVLLDIHPFREGNGRAIGEFLREFCEAKSKEINLGEYTIDWTLVDEKILFDSMPDGRTRNSLIENEFRKALVSKEDVKHL